VINNTKEFFNLTVSGSLFINNNFDVSTERFPVLIKKKTKTDQLNDLKFTNNFLRVDVTLNTIL